MKENLQELAAMISLDGLIDPNDANTLSLEFDWEYGWVCGFKQGNQFVLCVSQWHEIPEGAVSDCLGQARGKR